MVARVAIIARAIDSGRASTVAAPAMWAGLAYRYRGAR